MIIKILWTGCSNCKTLESNVKSALELLKIDAKVEKITDMEDIMTYDIMWTPWLVIDEKIVSAWKVLSIEELKEILLWNDIDKDSKKCCCSCNH